MSRSVLLPVLALAGVILFGINRSGPSEPAPAAVTSDAPRPAAPRAAPPPPVRATPPPAPALLSESAPEPPAPTDTTATREGTQRVGLTTRYAPLPEDTVARR